MSHFGLLHQKCKFWCGKVNVVFVIKPNCKACIPLLQTIYFHFEAIGWPAAKVTMRYWVITIIAGVMGLSIALLARVP